MQEIPIPTVHLFPALEEKLMELLQSLTPEEWQQQTIASKWKVKDVAAHLLDGNIRMLSFMRDNYAGDAPENIQSNEDLIAYLNRLNADFVQAMKRVSPPALIELMETTGKQYCQQISKLDPFALAIFPVSWAGEERSVNWFHIAREFTERWHHQQQIRDAVNKPGIMDRKFYYPVLDTFMQALPYTYRNTNAPENTVVKITLSGEAGGDWAMHKKETWQLVENIAQPFTTHVIIDGSIAWKLFTKSWRKENAMEHISIKGDASLAAPVLDMVSVMA
ncbi:MAG: maleylpyruvate isomerase N-terminal domain-containing protein [Chitinophagaceae bacterium]